MPTIPYKNKDGKRVKGVTTINNNVGWGKGGLMYWANQVGLEGKTLDEARDTATISGTIAHYLIECFLLKQKPDLTTYKKVDIDKGHIAFDNFKIWTKQFEFKPIAVEPHLVSEKYQYGLTPDVIAEVLGELALVDWKTGKTYASLFLQLAGYGQGWEENYPDKLLKGGYHVLRIPKDADIPSFHHSHWKVLPPEAWNSFADALDLSKNEKILSKLL